MVGNFSWGNAMSVKFAKYDETGCILFIGEVPEFMLELQGDNVYVGSVDQATQYIKAGALLDRPTSPAKLAGASLINLPSPCTITINGAAYPCADTSAELDFTYPGTYRVKVGAWPYLDAAFEVRK